MLKKLLIVTTIISLQARAQTANPDLEKRVADLTALVEKLQSRVTELESKAGISEPATPSDSPKAVVAAASPNSPTSTPTTAAPAPAAPPTGRALIGGTTINFLFDGYYGYNSNRPIGRVNLLRAYDVSSNAFSLNQADIIIENAPNPESGRRFGARLDLQFGQATATLQGNSVNELRPGIYRNIFQAYGTYVFSFSKGGSVDFGKFASSIGIEGNYSKDQMNYSRALWFSFLPYYHEGVRVNYKLNNKVAVTYWVTNGTQQTEPFNNYKDEFVGLTLTPSSKVTWNVNYYIGQEHPDVIVFTNGSAPAGLPTQQGTPFAPIPNAPKGKLDIIDSYLTWQIKPKLTLATEGDYVVERLYKNSAPQHTDGWVGYLQYRATHKLTFAGRAEYLSDRGGLFTGFTQAVKETTATASYSPADGLIIFGEWRRDFSNIPYFLTSQLNILKKEQNTSTLGLVFWFGGKQGTW